MRKTQQTVAPLVLPLRLHAKYNHRARTDAGAAYNAAVTGGGRADRPGGEPRHGARDIGGARRRPRSHRTGPSVRSVELNSPIGSHAALWPRCSARRRVALCGAPLSAAKPFLLISHVQCDAMRRCGRVTKCDADPRSCAALIALSASGGWRSFFLGIRWGLGHTTGLVVIAAIFFALNGQFDLAEVGHYGETCVGFFMIALGLWAAYGSVKMYRKGAQHVALISVEEECDEENGTDSEMQPMVILEPAEKAEQDRASRDRAHTGRVLCTPSFCGVECVCRAQGAIALSTGLVHGVAGPGQILGVLPAVIIMTGGEVAGSPHHEGAEDDQGHAWMAIVYLAAFGASSTLTMGWIAALYGEVTTWCGDARSVNLAVGLFSASFSILIGVVWLWYLLQGKEIDLSGVPLFG